MYVYVYIYIYIHNIIDMILYVVLGVLGQVGHADADGPRLGRRRVEAAGHDLGKV